MPRYPADQAIFRNYAGFKFIEPFPGLYLSSYYCLNPSLL
jgi:hypothetical protein